MNDEEIKKLIRDALQQSGITFNFTNVQGDVDGGVVQGSKQYTAEGLKNAPVLRVVDVKGTDNKGFYNSFIVTSESPPNTKKKNREQKEFYEQLNTLSAEEFLLAFTITLFNYGEQQFVTNIYEYILNEKFKELLSDDPNELIQARDVIKDQDSIHSMYALPKRKRKAVDLFGKGFHQSLKEIGANFDEQILSIGGVQHHIRIIKYESQEHFVAMWNIWRNEYPNLINEMKYEIKLLAMYGEFHERILASRALGEIAVANVPAAVSEYLDEYSQSHDLQVRYNVGFSLSAIAANDPRNLSIVFDLLKKWIKRDWRSRWTAVAAISRLYRYDAKVSVDVLTQTMEISEKLSREENQILELNPLTMVWHSASLMFLDGCVSEVLNMLHNWFTSGYRHKIAMPDIARELFLDIMQLHFDLGANKLIANKPIVEKAKDTLGENESRKKETSASEKSVDETSIQSAQLIDEVSNSVKEIETESNSQEKNQETKTNDGTSVQLTSDEKILMEPSLAKTDTSSEANINKRDIVEDKSVDDVVNRLDIKSISNLLWKNLYDEFKDNSKEIGCNTKIVAELTRESLSRSQSYSQSNLWFRPFGRKAPYQRMQDIIHSWLMLSKEDEFKYIQDPLYVIIMECYVNMGEEMRDIKLKNKLLAWHNDEREQELYQYKFIKEILSAMNQTSRQIVTP